MNNYTEHIKARRSVRTFDGRTLDESTKEQLLSFATNIQNPFGIPVDFKLNIQFVQNDPKLTSNTDVEYITSYSISQL